MYCRPRYLRGHGGVSIAWHKSLSNSVSKIVLPNTQRIVGIKLLSEPRPICFFSVYLPSRSGCTDVFKESLDYIDAVINNYSFDNDLILMGDFNADPGCSGGPLAETSINEQGRILSRYLAKWNYLSVHLCLTKNITTHTYVSEAHNSKSTIDHILTSSVYLRARFISSEVLDEDPNNLSDHLPVVAVLKTYCTLVPISNVNSNPIHSKSFRPNWSKLSKDELVYLYTEPLEQYLQFLPLLDIPHNVSSCVGIDRVESYVSQISSTLLRVAKEKIPAKRYYKHLILNWNEDLKDALN